MTATIITQDRIKELLYYNKQFGIFVWKISRGTAKAGSIAGHVDAHGYQIIKVDGTNYKAHRLAILYVNGKFPVDDVDHINGIRNHNSFINIRAATRTENTANQKIRNTNTSGIMGVCWHKASKKWSAYIMYGKERSTMGLHTDFFEACCARKSAELNLGFHPNHGRRA